MVGIYIDSQSLDIGCPGTTPIGQFVTTRGEAAYRLVNDTDTDTFFNILVELIDTEGNQREYSQTFQLVSANSNLEDSHVLITNTNYMNPGHVTATLKLEITGAAVFSDSLECNFDVV